MSTQRKLRKHGHVLADCLEYREVMTDIWGESRTGIRRVIEWAKVLEHTVPAAAEIGARSEAVQKTWR